MWLRWMGDVIWRETINPVWVESHLQKKKFHVEYQPILPQRYVLCYKEDVNVVS